MDTPNDIIRRPVHPGGQGKEVLRRVLGRGEKCDVAANRVGLFVSKSPTPGDPHQVPSSSDDSTPDDICEKNL